MRQAIIAAAISGAVAVAIGAWSAHGLSQLGEERLGWIDTALRYHIWHSLVLLGVGILAQIWGENRWLRRSALAFSVGVVLFSGSLYLLAATEMRWLGAVTPVGGLALIAGWLFLACAAGERTKPGNLP